MTRSVYDHLTVQWWWKTSSSITGKESFGVRSFPTEDGEKSLIGLQHQDAIHVAVQESTSVRQDLLNFCFIYNFKSEIKRKDW